MEEAEGFDFEELPSIELRNGVTLQPGINTIENQSETHCSKNEPIRVTMSNAKPSDEALFKVKSLKYGENQITKN